MTHKKGFTLTEVLLAVMIVAIVGVALASLTTAASRESGLGSSKITLRNRVSLAMRQIREDIASSSRIMFIKGENIGGVTPYFPLLLLAFNKNLAGTNLQNEADLLVPFMKDTNFVLYCARQDANNSSFMEIDRRILSEVPETLALDNACNDAGGEVILRNVRKITSGDFISPSFYGLDISEGSYTSLSFEPSNYYTSGVVRVRFVVSIPNAVPQLNEAVEEIFLTGGGAHR